MPVPKVETESAQARRNARVAEYLRARAAPQRQIVRQTPAAASRDKHLPLSGAAKTPSAQVPPRDQNEFGLALLRKLTGFLNHWRSCPVRACRRHRGCASARLECANARPRKPCTPENEQAALAYLQRALARRLAEVKGTEKR
jgi:hypothetical protein